MNVRLSLKYRIAVTIFVLEAIMMGLVLWQTLGHSFAASRAQYAETEQAILDVVSGIGRVALLTEEYADLQPYLENLQKDPHVVRAILGDVQGRVVASTHSSDVGMAFTTILSQHEHEHHVWFKKEISNAAGPLGELAIDFTDEALRKAYAQSRNLGIGIAAIGMAIIAIAGVLTGFLLTRRLERITVAAQRFAQGELTVQTGVHGNDELGELARSFDGMAKTVAENQLRIQESEHYNRMLFEQSPIGLMLCRMNGELVDLNPAYACIIGYTIEDAIELTSGDITPEKYATAEQHQLEALKKTGHYGPYEKEYIHRDGHLVPVRLQGRLVEQNGEPMIWSGVEDITERQQSEEIVRNIAAGVSAQTGEAFFESLALHLAKLFDTKHTFIGVLDDQKPGRINTIAWCSHGKIITDFHFDLAHTPCEQTVEGSNKDTVAYSHDLQELFPDDPLLKKMGLQSYIGAPLLDSTGKPIGLIAVMDDKPMVNTDQVKSVLKIFAIRAAAEMERLHTEEGLARSKAKFEAMFNAIPDAVMFADTQRRIVLNNPAVHEMFGYSDEELIGNTTEMLYADKQDYLNQGKRRYRTGSGTEQGPYEVRYKRKDGSVFWSETIGTQVTDANGNPIGFIAMFRDISERKQAEERATGLGQILDRSLNEIYIFDADTLQFIQVNHGASVNLGYSMEELRHLTPVDIKPEFTHASFAKMLEPLRSGEKEKIQFSTMHQRKDGSAYPVEVHLQLSSFESTPAFVAIILDITERKQSEAALRRAQKMEAIGRLSGGVAHDFNNQLSIIIGYLDFLKNRFREDEKPRQWVDTATKATLRCMDLTRQLLTFSRRQSIEKVAVNINAALKDMKTMIARSLTPEVEVQYFLADDLALTETDAGEFQDAILNLVINARDAMPNGGKLLIETTNKYLDADYAALNPGVTVGDYVQLMLSDTGTGMSADTLEHIFEPFFTTKPEGKGTGLGLPMVYGFVKRYGGYIKVYSELNMGTTIRLYLPSSKATVSAVLIEDKNKAGLPAGNESILIVDDEADLLELADQYLSDLGYHTHRAETAAQALEVLTNNPSIELLFSDVVMPGGMNGYELAKQATEQRPDLKVLLTSGFTSKTIVNNGLARFAAHLLTKPYRKADLAQRIRQVLDEETKA